MVQPKTEVWFVWRELKRVGDEEHPRLLVPWSDPQLYEHPMDWVFETPEAALEAKIDAGAEDEDWILCRETVEPLPTTVVPCKFCDQPVLKKYAHPHRGQWVGACCWDDRLQMTA